MKFEPPRAPQEKPLEEANLRPRKKFLFADRPPHVAPLFLRIPYE